MLDLREQAIRDLGGLIFEMFKHDRFNEELVRERCLELLELDRRLDELDELLPGGHRPGAARALRVRRGAAAVLPLLPQLRQPGAHSVVSASRSCPHCGAETGPGQEYCLSCGHRLGRAPQSDPLALAYARRARRRRRGRDDRGRRERERR